MTRRIIAMLFFVALPVGASAALMPALYNMEIQVAPESPSAGTPVVLTVHDPSDNGGTAYVWIVNGAVVEQGIGRKTISTIAPPVGSATTITVRAIENGEVVREAISAIRPGEIDIIWEGKTATHPFYDGLALPSGMSPITAIALPTVIVGGNQVENSRLLFSWSVDGKKLVKDSGQGKNTVTITPPRFTQPFVLSVSVETIDGTVTAKQTITIRPVNPTIILYENTPLAGLLLHRAVGNVFLFKEDEATLEAFPFFQSKNDTLLHEWTLDGESFTVDSPTPLRTTLRKSGTSGTHILTFSFENPLKFLENAERAIQLTW